MVLSVRFLKCPPSQIPGQSPPPLPPPLSPLSPFPRGPADGVGTGPVPPSLPQTQTDSPPAEWRSRPKHARTREHTTLAQHSLAKRVDVLRNPARLACIARVGDSARSRRRLHAARGVGVYARRCADAHHAVDERVGRAAGRTVS